MLDDNILGELDKHFEVMYANADEAISLGLRKISGFPSPQPSPIFIKIFSWVVSQEIGVLKPQKLSTNYSPDHSMVRPTTRTITSPCMLEMLTVHETKRVIHEYIQWRSSIQSSQLPNQSLDHTQNYGIKTCSEATQEGCSHHKSHCQIRVPGRTYLSTLQVQC